MADKEDTVKATTPPAPEPAPTMLNRMDKAVAGTMRNHLRQRGGAPSARQTVGMPGQVVAQAIAEHSEDRHEPSPMKMLAHKTNLAMQLSGHVSQVGSRSFADSFLKARDDAKARDAFLVRIPKQDLADPVTAERFRQDLAHLAANAASAHDPAKPIEPARAAAQFNSAARWPGATVKFHLRHLGIREDAELAANLSAYARGGRERLVEAGLLPPIGKGAERQGPAGRGEREDVHGAARAIGADPIEDVLRRGREFRRDDDANQRPPRALPGPRRDGHER